jgi:hypothetical protein
MVTVAAVLVVASGIGVADAQQGMPGMMQGGGMSMGHEGMGHEGIMMMCRMAFADAFRATGQKMGQHCAMAKEHGGAMMSADLPERLNMMEQHMTLHLDSLRAIKAAVQPLYSVLSDEQKKTANEIMKGPMGRM